MDRVDRERWTELEILGEERELTEEETNELDSYRDCGTDNGLMWHEATGAVIERYGDSSEDSEPEPEEPEGPAEDWQQRWAYLEELFPGRSFNNAEMEEIRTLRLRAESEGLTHNRGNLTPGSPLEGQEVPLQTVLDTDGMMQRIVREAYDAAGTTPRLRHEEMNPGEGRRARAAARPSIVRDQPRNVAPIPEVERIIEEEEVGATATEARLLCGMCGTRGYGRRLMCGCWACVSCRRLVYPNPNCAVGVSQIAFVLRAEDRGDRLIEARRNLDLNHPATGGERTTHDWTVLLARCPFCTYAGNVDRNDGHLNCASCGERIADNEWGLRSLQNILSMPTSSEIAEKIGAIMNGMEGWQRDYTSQAFTKSFAVEIDEELTIRGIVRWDEEMIEAFAADISRRRGTTSPRMTWNSSDGRGHPHMGGTPDQCFSLDIPSRTFTTALRGGNIDGLLLEVVTKAVNSPAVINPASPMNNWGRCRGCNRFRPRARLCDMCGHAYCFICLRTHEVECAETTPRRYWSRHPNTGKVERTVLVGAGITGSWVYPVLLRATSETVTVFDPDTIDPGNPHGLWLNWYDNDQRRLLRKAQQMVSRGGPVVPITAMADPVRYEAPDLLVLCPDNAQARRRAIPTVAPVGMMRVLDIRATPTGLTVWAFMMGSPWKGLWEQSLEGYEGRERCGEGEGHDNVPMEAGTLTAAFAAWWFAQDMPEGIWTIPFGFEGAAQEVQDAQSADRE